MHLFLTRSVSAHDDARQSSRTGNSGLTNTTCSSARSSSSLETILSTQRLFHIVKIEDMQREHHYNLERFEWADIVAIMKTSAVSLTQQEAFVKRTQEEDLRSASIVASRVTERAVNLLGKNEYWRVRKAADKQKEKTSEEERRPVWNYRVGSANSPNRDSNIRRMHSSDAGSESGIGKDQGAGVGCFGCLHREIEVPTPKPLTPASVKRANRQTIDTTTSIHVYSQDEGQQQHHHLRAAGHDAQVEHNSDHTSQSPLSSSVCAAAPAFVFSERTKAWSRPWSEPCLPLSCDDDGPPKVWNVIVGNPKEAERMELVARDLLCLEERRCFEQVELKYKQLELYSNEAAAKKEQQKRIAEQKEKEKAEAEAKRNLRERECRAFEASVSVLNASRCAVATEKAQAREREVQLAKLIEKEREELLAERLGLMQRLKSEERKAEEECHTKQRALLSASYSSNRQQYDRNTSPSPAPWSARLASNKTPFSSSPSRFGRETTERRGRRGEEVGKEENNDNDISLLSNTSNTTTRTHHCENPGGSEEALIEELSSTPSPRASEPLPSPTSQILAEDGDGGYASNEKSPLSRADRRDCGGRPPSFVACVPRALSSMRARSGKALLLSSPSSSPLAASLQRASSAHPVSTFSQTRTARTAGLGNSNRNQNFGENTTMIVFRNQMARSCGVLRPLRLASSSCEGNSTKNNNNTVHYANSKKDSSAEKEREERFKNKMLSHCEELEQEEAENGQHSPKRLQEDGHSNTYTSKYSPKGGSTDARERATPISGLQTLFPECAPHHRSVRSILPSQSSSTRLCSSPSHQPYATEHTSTHLPVNPLGGRSSTERGELKKSYSTIAFPLSPSKAVREAEGLNNKSITTKVRRLVGMEEAQRRREQGKRLPFLAAHRELNEELYGRAGSPTKRIMDGCT